MWIVRLALLLMILGPIAVLNTPTDIFPNIDIPVVSVVWQYTGLSPNQLATRIVSQSARTMTTTVNEIEHIESQSMNGIGVIKIFFQPHVNIGNAVAQVTAVSQTQLRQLPQGTTPPLIIQYSASSVPIIQVGLSGQGLTESQLNDLGLNFIRTQMVTVEGAGVPYPYGGKQRQVQVDIDLPKLQAKGLSPSDIVTTINAQNVILPSGTAKIGPFEYLVETNSAPEKVAELNDLPIRSVNGAMVYVRDVAHVRDGFPPQTNIVRVDGQRASLLSVIKTGDASTLTIVAGVRAKLEALKNQLPPTLRMQPLGDQSIFVRASISGVVREGIIAACLTAIMILVFLGSWRSTLIVAVSIPLSILTSLLVLSALGETINIMTLGGLALAVGILVDDATVEIENINRLMPLGKPLHDTILLGAQQIATPAFVATLSICIVFVPIFFLRGIAGYLFRPLAEAVVFAMLASYLLSRTIVPTLVLFFFRAERRMHKEHPEGDPHPGLFRRVHLAFEHGFENLRDRYVVLLEWCLHNRLVFSALFLAFCAVSMLLIPFLGSDLFPTVDSGQIRLHLRAPTGLRVEETAALCDRVEDSIRKQIPTHEVQGILDNIGLPYSGINLSYSTAGTIGTSDAEILISLNEDHRPTADYVRELRKTLPGEFPGTAFFFQPADIVSQILNFGLPSPIDVQLVGPNFADNFELARKMLPRIQEVGGAVDVHIQQALDLPKLHVDVDRTRAQSVGFTQQDVANNALVALTNSFQTAPNFWVSPDRKSVV